LTVKTRTFGRRGETTRGNKTNPSPPHGTRFKKGKKKPPPPPPPPYDFMACAWTTLTLPFVLKSTHKNLANFHLIPGSENTSHECAEKK